MYIVVLTGLSATLQAIIDLIPKYSFYVDTLADNIKMIHHYREKQERKTTGTTEVKGELKETLIATTLKVQRKIVALAINNQNSELQKVVTYSKSELTNSADTILTDRCLIVLNTAHQYETELEPYGLTPVLISQLSQDISKFRDFIPNPRLKITIKKDATDELNTLFAQTDDHLKKMDKVFEITRDDHYEFYRNYKSNRILINPGSHTVAIAGSIKDANEKPIAHVVITEPKTAFRHITGRRGTFRIKKMTPGIYDFTFSKNGYTERTIKVAVNEKEPTEVKVILNERKE